MSTWEEIRRLAADLQRVQLGDAVKRLSDRNCVEVVAKLAELCLVDLIYTIDGREYITKDYLKTQIANECVGNKGRVSLVDLQQLLNVEYRRIEECASRLVAEDDSFRLSMGQLISEVYLEAIRVDLRERLADEGKAALSDISKAFDLPAELLRDSVFVAESLGPNVRAGVDEGGAAALYTVEFAATQSALLRGALSGATKVTPLKALMGRAGVQERMATQCLNELLASGDVPGELVGGRQSERALFVPHRYTQLMRAHAVDFFQQNGYIDFAALKKLGVADVAAYVDDVAGPSESAGLVQLSSMALSGRLWQETESAAATAAAHADWLDVAAHLPLDDATADDVRLVALRLQPTLGVDWKLSNDAYLYREAALLKLCTDALESLLLAKVEREAPTVSRVMKEMQAAKDEPPEASAASKKKAGKKGGKAKAGRGGGGRDNAAEPAARSNVFEFLDEDELLAALADCERTAALAAPVAADLVELLRPQLNAVYRSKLESVYLTAEASASTNQKKTHSKFQEQFTALFESICLFDDSAQSFDDAVCAQLRQFLMRTLCVEAAERALAYMCGTTVQPQQSAKSRDALVESLPSAAARDAFKRLFVVVAAKRDDLGDFFDALDAVAEPTVCALKLKPPDKKARAELVGKYASELRAQVEAATDAATGLLLVLLLLVARHHAIAVHASGKFVPALALFVQSRLPKEMQLQISQVQLLVVKSLKNSGDATLAADLSEKFAELKRVVLTSGDSVNA